MDLPLPWERLVWSGRPFRILRRIRAERYLLTDLRLVRVAGSHVDELVLHDIGDVHRVESPLDRALGTSTIVVRARTNGRPGIVLHGVRRGQQLAALLELLAGDPYASADVDAIRAALAWTPQPVVPVYREAMGALAAVAVVMTAVIVAPRGKAAPIAYAADDAIAPGGVKKSRAEIVRFMEADVMPWARRALAPIVGDASRVTCETCHGAAASSRGWQMPAVPALPLPAVRERGWEIYNDNLDAQMRNAIYGYVAESDKQARAAYMREVVVPGMSGLLRRPAYDFTRTYEYNRSRGALGCYHCHRVK